MKRYAKWILAGWIGMLGLQASLFAQEHGAVPTESACEPACEPTYPPECEAACDAPVMMPIYAGCLHERDKLTGDWLGTRTHMLESGMVWDIDQTAFYYGVTSGGQDERFTFAGHGDYVLNWDLGKAGVQEGLFFKMRAEHRYGQSISNYDGAFLPATIVTDLPESDSDQLYLTNVLFTQFLSENFAVFAGKIDTLDGDANAFAHRRGKDQFSNLAFVANPLLLRAVPYSTLATGFSIIADQQPVFTFSVLNATDTTGTSGFSELFNEGAALTAEARLPYTWGELPGHQLVGGAWNSRDYVTLGQDPRILLPDVPIAQQQGTWGLYWNMDQYLHMYDGAPGKGWGVFGRAGIADDEANPLAHFFSAGIGGDSPICGRHDDAFGVGYYYLATSDDIGIFIENVLGPVGDGHGVELFYNYQVTKWFHLTADMQVLEPEVQELDTAVLAGLRAKIDF